MAISVGSPLPDVELFKWNGEEMVRRSSTEIVSSGITMIIGVIGAFMPMCTRTHLKDYLQLVSVLQTSGSVDRVLCIAVADPFSMFAWGNSMGAQGKTEMWSDAYGTFSSAIGITFDLTHMGLGVRSGRYSMIVENNIVQTLNIEPDPRKVTVSGVETMREQFEF